MLELQTNCKPSCKPKLEVSFVLFFFAETRPVLFFFFFLLFLSFSPDKASRMVTTYAKKGD